MLETILSDSHKWTDSMPPEESALADYEQVSVQLPDIHVGLPAAMPSIHSSPAPESRIGAASDIDYHPNQARILNESRAMDNIRNFHTISPMSSSQDASFEPMYGRVGSSNYKLTSRNFPNVSYNLQHDKRFARYD